MIVICIYFEMFLGCRLCFNLIKENLRNSAHYACSFVDLVLVLCTDFCVLAYKLLNFQVQDL